VRAQGRSSAIQRRTPDVPRVRQVCVPAAMSRKNPYSKPDRLTRAAKDAGFPARSVFKLREMDRRAHLFRGGMRVLDLGAAPGSWSLYAAQRIGASGKLLSVDLEPLAAALPPQAAFLQGDLFALDDASLGRFAPYHVVLSDMAPRTTGSRPTDQARSFELFMRALDVAVRLGAPGGAFVGKIFMSDDLPLARAELRRHYATERLIRPEGTRAVSTEIFAVGSGKLR
jgi:23S rRNA (uridine2552-2'-O)-methyltransferase